jgi:hypothetical protein
LKGKHKWGKSSEDSSTGRSGGRSGLIVCFKCFKVGHGVADCSDRTAGWRLTPEAKEKAFALRDALRDVVAAKSTPTTSPGERKVSFAEEETKGVPK